MMKFYWEEKSKQVKIQERVRGLSVKLEHNGEKR